MTNADVSIFFFFKNMENASLKISGEIVSKSIVYLAAAVVLACVLIYAQ